MESFKEWLQKEENNFPHQQFDEIDWGKTLDWGQNALSAAGMGADFLGGIGGIPFDLANAGISAARGNWGDAAMNALAAVPIVGNVSKGAQLAGKAAKYAPDVAQLAGKAAKVAPDVGAISKGGGYLSKLGRGVLDFGKNMGKGILANTAMSGVAGMLPNYGYAQPNYAKTPSATSGLSAGLSATPVIGQYGNYMQTLMQNPSLLQMLMSMFMGRR